MKHPVFVRLDDAAFAALVKGQVVEIAGLCGTELVNVRLILADIGFQRMLTHLDNAIMERPLPGD